MKMSRRSWAIVGSLWWVAATAIAAGPLDPLEGPRVAVPEPAPQKAPAPPPAPPAARQKADVPPADRIRQATEIVRDAFQDLYASQRGGDQNAGAVLVGKLLATAAATQEPDRRFALLNEAQQVAVEAGLVDRAIVAIAPNGKVARRAMATMAVPASVSW